jgi:hypothetical protein
MLNWEKDKARHKATEPSYDYLPRTGSWADMRRWEIENNQPRGFRYKSNPQSKTNYGFNDLTHNINQLALYVECVHSAYFWKKSARDRNEVVMIVGKLTRRITDLNASLTYEQLKLVDKAKTILAEFAH